MANVTYTGASTPSLVVSSSGVGNPCDSRDPPTLPGNIGVSIPGGYDLMTYQRLASVLYAHPSPATHLEPPAGAAAPPTPPGHPSLLGGQEHLLHGGNLELKEGIGGLGTAWPYPMYYPYDTLAAYPFTHGYGMTFDAARRKNATRETTATLKAWLNEHKKNPYPTKGEKIMLAIITKMTLTQVSTWFANARRRLKKENKMTWEPRNKTDDDDDDDDLKDDVSSDNERRKDLETSDRARDDVSESGGDDRLERGSPGRLPSPAEIPCSTNGHATSASPVKPRIWSLADMAASSSGPPVTAPAVVGASKLLHRPLHLEASPYGRPLAALNPRLASPQEALLQVYAKSLGLPPHAAAAAAFPPLALNGFGGHLVAPHSMAGGEHLPPTLMSHPLTSVTLTPSHSSPTHIPISKPVATRPLPHSPPIFAPIHQTLPGGAKITPASLSATPPSPLSPNGDGCHD